MYLDEFEEHYLDEDEPVDWNEVASEEAQDALEEAENGADE